MTLQEIQRRLLAEYEERRNLEELRQKEATKTLFSRLPELQKLEIDHARMNVELLRGLQESPEDVASVQKHLEQLEKTFQEEKQRLLLSISLKEDPRQAHYSCQLCQDHGYRQGSMCPCMRQELAQRIFQAEYERGGSQVSLSKMDFSIYSTKPEKKGESQRSNMISIAQSLSTFVKNFSQEQGMNLIFSGEVSQGKTFLAAALALELIHEGHLVIYQTAPSLVDKLRDMSWRYNEDHAQMKRMIYDCDFLILDDLGKETRTEFAEKELFHLINMRYSAGKSTLISTNLSYDELRKRYGDAFFTRLMENCYLPEFFGPDLRIGG